LGQSGTAKPASWLVTSPPAQIKQIVAPAVSHAKRPSQADGVERVGTEAFGDGMEKPL
jgi:hypothetical protein